MIEIESKGIFNKHFWGIALLFILGQSICAFPVKIGDNTLLYYLLSAAAGAVLLTVEGIVAKRFFKIKKNTPFKKAVCAVVYFRIAIYAITTFADSLLSFKEVLWNLFFSQNKAIGLILFLFAVFYFSKRRQEDILKFSLIASVFCAVVIILFAVFLYENYDFTNFKILDTYTFESGIKEVWLILRKIFLPVGLLVFYEHFALFSERKTALFTGYFSGVLLLSSAIICPMLIFGTDFIKLLDFPFNSAVGTLSIGRLFSRLDGIMYAVYFLCCLMKCVLCVFVAKKTLKEMLNIFNRKSG